MMIPFINEYRKFRYLVLEEVGDVRDADIIALFSLYLDRKILNPFGGLETFFKHFSSMVEPTDPDDESNDDDPFSNSSGSGVV
ncbi:MAG: hypothetical protein GY751_05405 [Bacteroidetes bacterium]|nr:hypothetical protein [Bacteroidota bacterium]